MISIGNLFALSMEGCYSIGVKSRYGDVNTLIKLRDILESYSTVCLSSCAGRAQGSVSIPNYPDNQKSKYVEDMKEFLSSVTLHGTTPLFSMSTSAHNNINPLYVLCGQLMQTNKQHYLQYKDELQSYVHFLSEDYPCGSYPGFVSHISTSEQIIDGRHFLLIFAHTNQCMTCGINSMLGQNEWITLDVQSFILSIFWPMIGSHVTSSRSRMADPYPFKNLRGNYLIKKIKKIYKKQQKNNIKLVKALDDSLSDEMLDYLIYICLLKFELDLCDDFAYEEFKMKKNLFYSVISLISVFNFSRSKNDPCGIRSFFNFCSFSTSTSDPIVDRALSYFDKGLIYRSDDVNNVYAQGGITNALYNLLPNMGINDMTEGLSNNLEGVGEAIGKANEILDSLNDKTKCFDETMNYVLKDMGPKMMILVVVSVSAYGVIKYYIEGDRSILIQMGVFVAASVVVMPDEIKSILLSYLNIAEVDKSTEQDPVHAQSPFDWGPIVKLMTLAVGFISGLDLKNFKFKMKDVIGALGALPKIESGISYCMEAIPTIVNAAVNFVREHIFGLHPVMKDKTHIAEIDKFLDDCNSIIEKHYDAKPPYKREDFNKIILLQQKCSRFYAKDYGSRTTTNDVRKVLTRYQALLEKVRKPYDSTSLRAEFARCEPLVVLIRGEPGQGKSVAGSVFAQAMAARLLGVDADLVTKNTTDYIYSRNAENIYWEGYGGQFCTFMDDFGQCKDIAGTPDNEYMNLIRLGNSFQAPLHMASLESKANTFFQSQLIVCTTNQYTFNSVQSIHFKSALTRRFDVVVDIRVNDEIDPITGEYLYAKDHAGKLMLDSNKWCAEAVLVDVYKGMTTESKGDLIETISFYKFVDMCENRFMCKQSAYENIVKNNAEILSDIIDLPNSHPVLDMETIDLEDGEELLEVEEEEVESESIAFDDIEFPTNDFYSFFFDPRQSWFDKLSSICMKTPFLVDSFIRDIYFKLKRKFADVSGMIRRKVSSMKKSIGGALKTLYEFSSGVFTIVKFTVSQLFKQFPIIKLATEITMWYAMYRMILWFITPRKDANSGKNARVGPQTKASRYTRDKANNRLAISQNAMEQNVIAKKVTDRNTLLVRKSGCDVIWARATIIKGSVCMIPNHYFQIAHEKVRVGDWDLSECIDYYTSKDILVKESTVKEFLDMFRYDMPNYDVSFFVLPGRLKTFPDITKHFMKRSDLPTKYLPSLLFVPRDEGNVDVMEFESVISDQRQYYISEMGHKLYTQCHAKYNANTNFGDCGSLLFAKDTNFYPKPIYGMHVAGAKTLMSDIGYSTVITYEIIEEALSKFDDIEKCSPPIDSFPYLIDTDTTTVFGDNFRLACKATLAIGSANKTQLCKINSIYGVLGDCTIAPAKLGSFTRGDKIIDPFANRLVSYTKHSSYMPEEILDSIAVSYAQYVIDNSDELEYKVLSFEDSVKGLENEPYMNGIPRGTSAGYPQCKLKPPGIKGKRYLFGEDGDYEFDSKDCQHLFSEVNDIIEQAREGKRCLHIYADFLKDETRPIDKVEKPRIVSCAPVAYTIAVRTRFLSIISWLMRNRIRNGMAVGTNPYSEWTAVAKYLENDSIDCMIAGDFSGFDTTINSSFWKPVNTFFSVILKKFSLEDYKKEAKIMSILLLEVFNSVHIRGSAIYYWNAGMPSGNPLTTIVNCIVNQIIIRFTWIICNGRRLSTLNTFTENIKAIVYGDDNLISVSNDAKSKFNPTTIRTAFAEIGFTYTSETKVTEINHFRTIYEVNFLKRNFVWHDFDDEEGGGIMLSPLDYETIRQMLYYGRKNKDFKSVVQQSFESFLHELALHDKETWDKCYNIVAPIMESDFDYVSDTTEHSERLKKTLRLTSVY